MIKKLVFFLVVISIIVFGIYALLNISVDKIDCFNQYTRCEKRENLVSFGLGKNIFLSKREIESRLENDSTVEEYKVYIKSPSHIEVRIIEDSPDYALFSEELGIFALIRDREVVSITDSTNLDFVTTKEKIPSVGESIGEKEYFALKIFSKLPLEIEKKAKIFDNTLEVRSKNLPKIIYPLSGDEDVLVGSTLLILSRLKADGQIFRIGEYDTVSEIDLRFKNAVLR